jgi:hypothetical protein
MKTFLTCIAFVLLFTFSSCQKENDIEVENPTIGLVKLGETYAVGAATKLELWSSTVLATGHNKIYLRAYDSLTNKLLNKSLFKIKPLMMMKMDDHHMSHAAPSENPISSISEDGLFPVSVVFTMPSSGDTNTWKLEVETQKEEGSIFGKASFPLTVIQSNPSKVKTFKSTNGANYIISYLASAKPKVGNNEIEFVVFNRLDMMNFPPIEDFAIQMTPEMPSMGHGSPNNINPVHIGRGHYKGVVNFTMTGEWEINLSLTRNGESVSTSFNINL